LTNHLKCYKINYIEFNIVKSNKIYIKEYLMQENNNQPKAERDRGRHHRPEGNPENRPLEEHEGFDNRHHRGGRFHRGRNFWRDWLDERHHHGHDGEFQPGQALSLKEMEAWREFFHQSFGTWPEDHWIIGGRRFSPWHQGMDTFNPFVANLLSKGGGLLPLYVLHLIAQQPRYGNEIMDILADRTNGQWVSNPGAIYPLLTIMEREGFIQGEWSDPSKRTMRVYTITSNGQAELTRIKTIVVPKVAETVSVLEAFLQDLQGQAQSPADEADSSEQKGEFNE
jgi:PadR family transcriptional regulator PadR